MHSTQEREYTADEIFTKKWYRNWGVTDDEYDLICRLLDRRPNYTETGLFSVMWSEHCSYKHSKRILREFPTSGKQVLQGPGEGAGIVDIGDQLAVVFKAESHNHPSAVEPYEGAATGVGGIIRDIFSMGARPIALLDSLRFGELDHPRTRYLLEQVVAGIGGYGNCIGIPTVGGELSFDACYEGNPLVNAMCVGLIEHDQIQKGQAKGVGNPIFYVGAKTGRDGIHGATFASEEFTDDKDQNRSAVQVGDPFMEKLLLEACLELIHHHSEAVVGIQDMGAAGLVSSSAEMASKAQAGLILYLDDVPQRETDMTPYEMMLSESQERMLICVNKGYEDVVKEIFARYHLEAVEIGHVADNQDYRLYHKGICVADIPVTALVDEAPEYELPEIKPARLKTASVYTIPSLDIAETAKALLNQPTIASKRSVFETYDSQVLTNTVVTPGSDAAVVRIKGTTKAIAMTMDCNARYLYLDPYVGGQMAVAEAARNLVASGAKPLAITDCLNYGSPENPEVFYELVHSAKGIATACRALNTPVISGNVSLYNETNGNAIFPTPIIGMVGLIEQVEKTTTQWFKQASDLIYVIGQTDAFFAGSEVQKWIEGEIFGQLGHFDLEKEVRHQAIVSKAIEKGYLQSAHDCAEGGVFITLAESAMQAKLGFDIQWTDPEEWLFSETPSRFIVTVKKEHQQLFEAIANGHAHLLGCVTLDQQMTIATSDHSYAFDVKEMTKIWEDALCTQLKTKA